MKSLSDLFILIATAVLAVRAENGILRLICRIFLTVIAVYVLISILLVFADAVRPFLPFLSP